MRIWTWKSMHNNIEISVLPIVSQCVVLLYYWTQHDFFSKLNYELNKDENIFSALPTHCVIVFFPMCEALKNSQISHYNGYTMRLLNS